MHSLDYESYSVSENINRKLSERQAVCKWMLMLSSEFKLGAFE